MNRSQRYLGIDIGGTKSACVVGTASGEVLARAEWPSRADRGPDAMIAMLLAEARRLQAEHQPIAVGVAIGGPLDCERGVVLSPPNLPGWNALPLRARLEDALGLPVRVEHDAAACALAEARWGSGRELGPDATLLYLTCGTGFGIGIVMGGRVYHGAGGRSPEIGHVSFADDGPTAFGKRGSVEAYCAGSSLPRLAAWKFPKRWGDRPPDGRELSTLTAGGDADAQSILDLHADATGLVCAALVDLLFPHAIVLGSLARYLGAGWQQRVRAVVKREALPDAAALCRIVPSLLAERLQDLSALVVAVDAARPEQGR